MTVCPLSAFLMISSMENFSTLSIPTVGSSRNRIEGLRNRHRVNASNFFCPPESRRPPAKSWSSGFPGGQKKLLTLTRCLLRNPSILFLDEPTVGMDNVEKFSMLEIIKNALRGHTVMVVDHDLRWLMPFCDYFVVLDNGKIAEQGTAQELLQRGGLFAELYHAEDAKPGGADDAHTSAPPPQMAGAGLSGKARPG